MVADDLLQVLTFTVNFVKKSTVNVSDCYSQLFWGKSQQKIVSTCNILLQSTFCYRLCSSSATMCAMYHYTIYQVMISFTRWLVRSLRSLIAVDGHGHVRGWPRKGPRMATEGVTDIFKASPGHVQGPVQG